MKKAAAVHPDIQGSGDADEYIKIKEAYEQIKKNKHNTSSHRFTEGDQFSSKTFDKANYNDQSKKYNRAPPGTEDHHRLYKKQYWDPNLMKMIGEEGLKAGHRFGLNEKAGIFSRSALSSDATNWKDNSLNVPFIKGLGFTSIIYVFLYL